MRRAFVLALVALAACSAAHPARTTAVQGPTAMPPDRHADIDSLSQQIDDERQQLSLPAPAPSATVPAPAPFSTPVSVKTDDKCHPAQTQTCTDTCKLSDTICDNTDKICKLAAGLVGDTWAAGKCDTAKQTCDAAHAKCCACAS